MSRTRAERRHFRDVTLARMRRYVRSWSGKYDEEFVENFARKMRDNPALCSGRCCGNQRQYEGAPISELRRLGDDGV